MLNPGEIGEQKIKESQGKKMTQPQKSEPCNAYR